MRERGKLAHDSLELAQDRQAQRSLEQLEALGDERDARAGAPRGAGARARPRRGRAAASCSSSCRPRPRARARGAARRAGAHRAGRARRAPRPGDRRRATACRPRSQEGPRADRAPPRRGAQRARARGRAAAARPTRRSSSSTRRSASRRSSAGSQSGLRERYESSASSVESLEVEVRAATRDREALRERLGARTSSSVHDARMQLEQLVAVDPRALRGRPDRAASAAPVTRPSCPAPPRSARPSSSACARRCARWARCTWARSRSTRKSRERCRYLDEQKTDLELSIERLRGAIARINRTSRERFRETFDAVDKVFQNGVPEDVRGRPRAPRR